MCGIAGIFYWDQERCVADFLIREMTSTMTHRGPDDEGIFVKDNVGLGHRRLSIIDLSSGHQPMMSNDGTVAIVFNGEIYNFGELRLLLQNKGHQFTTNSDTEVILQGYLEWGEEIVPRLRGMFAFAIWDGNKRELLLVRDRLGKKPLYYAENKNGIAFASEIKALFKARVVKPEVNLGAIDTFFSLGYTLSPYSMFKNVMKLDAGHLMVVDRKNKARIRKYWSLEQFLNQSAGGIGSEKHCEEILLSILRDSVKLRMISDVPFGAFLSGGIDSSIIVGLMAENSDSPVKTFTVGYRDAPEHSELRYARVVANHFKTEHHEIILEPVDFYESVDSMVFHSEEPIGDQACVPLWLLSMKARDYVTVMLSGEGSDEIFGGYQIYWFMKHLLWYSTLPKPLRKALIFPVMQALLGKRRAVKYDYWAELPLSRRFLGDMADLPEPVKAHLYSPELKRISYGAPVFECLASYYEEVAGLDEYSQMMYLDIKTWLVEDLLLKADKMTMAASLELRCPMLDHKLVEFSQSLPSNLKIRGMKTKYLLKRAVSGFIPREIVKRKKMGFPVPLHGWFEKDLYVQIRALLEEQRTRDRGYFEKNYIDDILRHHHMGSDDYSKLVWNLVVFEMWHRRFIDNSQSIMRPEDVN